MTKRSTRFYRKNEVEIMHRLGINPTINSGAGWIQKEDGESDLFMCQLKSTDNKSISVKQEDINALEYHACTSHKIPVFALQFLTTDSVYVMIPEEEFKEYQEYKKAKQNETFSQKSVDIEEEKEYNKDTQKVNRDINKMRSTREQFYKQMEQEREQQDRDFKAKIKERRKATWKRSSDKKA